jgi:aminoglycoside phosphotransferase (APT) family kinase protein
MSPHLSTSSTSPAYVVDASCVETSPIGTSTQHVNDLKDGVDQQQQKAHDGVASEVATTLCGQEPFETFQHKVAEFVTEHFRRSLKDIAIYEMTGGTYNRVIGVTIASYPKKFGLHSFLTCFLGVRKKKSVAKFDSYIVRIPRMSFSGDDSDTHMAKKMKHEVSILEAVGSRLPLPIPKVFSYDLTTTNMCERPYMIQTRLPGRNLGLDLWNHLNMQQKQCIAKHVTNLASIIASVEGPAGDISSENLSQSSTSPICVNTFCAPAYDDQPTCKPALARKPIDHLLEQCERWRAWERSTGFCFEEVWDGFETISRALEMRGFLDGPCVLVHGDLKPYNLLAEVRNETEVDITGVIDWDSAIIAPEFMAYRAPFWLWTPEDMDSDKEDEECVADVEPVTDEDRMLKQVFLDNASEKYKLYAFAPEAMLARRMFFILRESLRSDWEFEEAKSVIREWIELHPEDGVQPVPSDTDSEPESGSDDDQDDNE